MLRHVRAESELPMVAHQLGPGWKALVDDLNRRLWRLLPSAMARATIGDDGLLRLTVYDPEQRAEVDALCADLLARASRLCELCGAPGGLRCGVVLTVRCARCGT